MTEETIGKYRLIQQLGYGGFATVYQAEDTELGRMVAIKVLHPHFVASNQTHLVERFYKEARIMASLRHRHIVTVHERNRTEDGRFYIVMEYLPGGTLQDRLNAQGALSLQETLDILRPLAQAFDKAHDQGIVHRDLKAENIPSAPTKVSNFGKVGNFSATSISLGAIAIAIVLAILCLALGIPRLTALLPSTTETRQLANSQRQPLH